MGAKTRALRWCEVTSTAAIEIPPTVWTNTSCFAVHTPERLSDPIEFLCFIFGGDPPGNLVLFTLPEERTYWLDSTDTEKIRRVIQSAASTHNVYFCMSTQDRDKAESLWKKKHPQTDSDPTTRGYADTAVAIPGVWADIDVQSLVHRDDHLPATKEEAFDLLIQFPLAATIIWDTGYGLQALWLFREPWIFTDARERDDGKVFMRRFTEALNERAQYRGWRVDPQVKDLARVLRMPSTYNRKVASTPLVVQVIHVDSEARYNQSDFLPFFPVSSGKAKSFTAPTTEEQQRILADARAALAFLVADDYDLWLKMGMALHSASIGEDAYQVWEQWSASYPEKFDAAVCRYKWQSFRVPEDGETGKITIATLFNAAIHAGWRSDVHEAPPEEEDTPSLESQEQKIFPCTDMGNAERLRHRYGKRLLWCDLWKKFLTWDGKRWRVDDRQRVRRWAKNTVRTIYQESGFPTQENDRKQLAKWAVTSESDNSIRAMISLVQPDLPVTPDALDTDPWLLTCTNGTIDLRIGVLLSYTPEHLITKISPVRYDAEATAPVWEAFLEQIFRGNQELINWLWKAIGYCLTGDTREQIFFLCHGAGSNGKSTFLDLLRVLLGDYAEQAPFSTFLRKDRDTIPNDLAKLHSCRFVAAVESEQGKRLAEAQIKGLTGNDAVTARFLHGEFFTYMPQFKIWLATNHRPEIQDSSHAMWRRMRLIPFEVTFSDEEQDKTLPAKLRAELPGILAWAVRGCLAWQQEGLSPAPEIVTQATEAYRTEQDFLADFIEEHCFVKQDAHVPATELYHRYKSWCGATGEEAVSQTKFGRMMGDRGFKKGKDTITRKVVYQRLMLKPE